MEPPRLEWAAHWLASTKHSYIDGAWTDTAHDPVHESINPANGLPLGTLQYASDTDVDRAVVGARRAFERDSWRTLSRRERARLLRRVGEVIRAHRAELATLISLENGKLYREAFDDDMPDTADVFDYYA